MLTGTSCSCLFVGAAWTRTSRHPTQAKPINHQTSSWIHQRISRISTARTGFGVDAREAALGRHVPAHAVGADRDVRARLPMRSYQLPVVLRTRHVSSSRRERPSGPACHAETLTDTCPDQNNLLSATGITDTHSVSAKAGTWLQGSGFAVKPYP